MNNENNENEEIDFYYEVSYIFPYSVRNHFMQEWSVIGKGLRTFQYPEQAYAFQYQQKIIYFSKKIQGTKKEDRPYLRRKIKDINKKLEKLIDKNAEYFIWEM